MPDENQPTNPAPPAPGSAPGNPAPNLVPSEPAPVVPPAVGGTVDPIAPAPSPPAATGGVQMPPPVSSQPSYAGFWIRLLAFIIDIVILGIVVGVPLNFVFGSGVVSSIQSGDLATAQRLSNMQSWITGIIQLAYFISLTTIFGGTLGKLVLGLRVVDANGQKINIVKAILREFIGKILSFLTLLLGFIMVGFDSKKQGLHDKIAGTYVVKVR